MTNALPTLKFKIEKELLKMAFTYVTTVTDEMGDFF